MYFLCLCSCVCIYGASCLFMPSYIWTHTREYVLSHGTVHLKVIGIVSQFHLMGVLSLTIYHILTYTQMCFHMYVHVCELSSLFCCDRQLVCHPAVLNYFSSYDLAINNKNKLSLFCQCFSNA